MKKTVKYFIPEKYKNDKELNRKSRFVIWFTFITTFVTIPISIFTYFQRPDDLGNIITAFLVPIVLAGCLLLFKRNGSFIIITHIFCSFFILVMAGAPSESGGVFSPDMPTLYIVPIFAVVMGSLRIGLFYSFLMMSIFILYYILEINGTIDLRSKTTIHPAEYFLMNLVFNAFIILFIVFRNEKLRLQAVGELKETNQLVSEKNKEITDSINYARRIQSAILPQKEYLQKFLPDSFFLYRPKDIVSGDFYWISERNGDVFVVVADCTGHGVPGAFMSVVGMNLLNEIVNHRHIFHPSDILKELNTGVVDALQQRATETNDGMDIALVKIPKTGGVIEYAAANRGLIYFRNGIKEDYKPSKYPIGGFNSMMEKKFETHQIKTQPGDIFYLSTDGFADQFGGSKNKKLTTRNFKRKLEQIFSLQLTNQENELDHFFTDWKKGYEQTDDVLVVGIRIK